MFTYVNLSLISLSIRIIVTFRYSVDTTADIIFGILREVKKVKHQLEIMLKVFIGAVFHYGSVDR